MLIKVNEKAKTIIDSMKGNDVDFNYIIKRNGTRFEIIAISGDGTIQNEQIANALYFDLLEQYTVDLILL